MIIWQSWRLWRFHVQGSWYLKVRRNIIIIILFRNITFQLFVQSRDIKPKTRNCVISDLLSTKYEAPKFVLTFGMLCAPEPAFVTSRYHALRCITQPFVREPCFTAGHQAANESVHALSLSDLRSDRRRIDPNICVRLRRNSAMSTLSPAENFRRLDAIIEVVYRRSGNFLYLFWSIKFSAHLVFVGRWGDQYFMYCEYKFSCFHFRR